MAKHQALSRLRPGFDSRWEHISETFKNKEVISFFMPKKARKTLDDILVNALGRIMGPAMEYLNNEFGAGLTERFFGLSIPSLFAMNVIGKGNYLREEIKKEFDAGNLRKNIHYEIGRGVGTASAVIFNIGIFCSYFNLLKG